MEFIAPPTVPAEVVQQVHAAWWKFWDASGYEEHGFQTCHLLPPADWQVVIWPEGFDDPYPQMEPGTQVRIIGEWRDNSSFAYSEYIYLTQEGVVGSTDIPLL